MERAIYPSDLTDAEWAVIEPLVPMPAPRGRPRKYGLREIVDAIFYVIRTGCQWRALPAEYPNWNTVHRYHLTWSRDGTWEAIALRERLAAWAPAPARTPG